MASMADLSEIAPLPESLANVLGNLSDLGNLMPMGPGGIAGSFLGGSCTCDPCKDVRGNIQEQEAKNLGAMYSGAKIAQTDALGNKTEITTSLKDEQNKATKEIRLIKEEIDKLERAESLILGCPIWNLSSLAEFLDKKIIYSENEWFLINISFWETIVGIAKDNEWATLYCPVSGTYWGEAESAMNRAEEKEEEETEKESLALEIAPISCSIEVPAGDVFERTKKTAYKIVERLEKIISANKELIEAVDELHTLVSQCSSQAPYPAVSNRKGCLSICIPTAFGCIERCVGQPCPDKSIEESFQQIINIIEGMPNRPAGEEKKEKEGIRDIVRAKKKNTPEATRDPDRREQIGLATIIDQEVPKILEDLEVLVRKPMKKCVGGTALLSCPSALRQIGPEGEPLKSCHREEGWYQDCVSQCYLEVGQKSYSACLKKCLEETGARYNVRDIAEGRHLFNFYCCHP